MNRAISFLVVFLWSISLPAVDYFVANTGANTNAGTFSQPFLTIQQAASLMRAGDTCYIRAGTYRETVVPTNSGTSAAPIIFCAYSNEIVTISGTELVTGWTQSTGMIYRAAMNWSLGDSNQIFVDGQMMNLARWPNSTLDISRPTRSIASDAGSEATARPDGWFYGWLTDSALTNAAGYWDGAILHFNPGEEWRAASGIVLSNDTGYLAYKWHNSNPSDDAYTPNAGTRYALSGKATLLDTFGEWYCDEGTQQLYLWTPKGDSPAAHIIEAKRRSLAFDLSGRAYIHLTGLHIFGATIFSTAASHHNVLDGLEARYLMHSASIPQAWTNFANVSGLVLNGASNVLQNSLIACSASSGVITLGTNQLITNCVIHDVNYLGADAGGIYTGFGSDTNGSIRHEFCYNTIYKTGSAAFMIRMWLGGRIHHNDAYSMNLMTSDVGGGVYIFNGEGTGTEIDHNWFHDITDRLNPGVGIYLDDYCRNFTVDHNLIWNCGEALTLNLWSHTNLVYNNTLLALTAYSLAGFPMIASEREMTGCQIINNIFNRSTVTVTGAVVQANIDSTVDPQFTDSTSFDFSLKSSSPARNAGAVLNGYTDGYLESAPDIGALEYGAAAWRAGAYWSTEPAHPTGLSGALNNGSVALSWTDNATNETEYVIDRSTDGRVWSRLVTLAANTTQYTDTALPAGTLWYRVRADESPYANYITVKNGHDPYSEMDGTANDATSGVTTNTAGVTPVITSCDASDWLRFDRVNFVNSATQLTVYASAATAGRHIEAWLDATNGTKIADISTIATSVGTYTNMTATISGNVSGEHTLYLRFSGGANVCNFGYCYFTAATSSASPAAPASLSAGSNSPVLVDLSWATSATNAYGFQIERSTDNQNYILVGSVNAGTTSFSDGTVSPGMSYYYRVRAYNATGTSDYAFPSEGGTLGSSVLAPQFTNLQYLGSGGVGLSFTGWPGVTYTVEYTGDFTNWTSVGTVTSTTSAFSCNDLAATNSIARFYRARWP